MRARRVRLAGTIRAGDGRVGPSAGQLRIARTPVEDAQTFHLRPKIENYDGDVQLVILRTARYDDEREEVDFGEISVFLAPTFVITVRQGVASDLREARARLEQRPNCSPAAAHPRYARSWIRSSTGPQPALS
jgi:hypothetical protein